MRVTQAEYARRRGISKQSVNERTRHQGGPIPTYGPRRLIDVGEADRLWEATMAANGHANASTRAARAALEAGDDEPGALASALELARARAGVMTAEAELRRLRLEERRGQLLDRHATLAKFFTVTRTLRDAWLAWPSRIGAELAADLGVEPARLMIALERYVRRQLTESADAALDLGGDVAATATGEDEDDADASDQRSPGARRNGRERATS